METYTVIAIADGNHRSENLGQKNLYTRPIPGQTINLNEVNPDLPEINVRVVRALDLENKILLYVTHPEIVREETMFDRKTRDRKGTGVNWL